jgi:hypothetical protein
VKKAKEGFFMAPLLPDCRSRGTSVFQNVVRAFLSGTGLPFAEVLSAERIERVFRKHRCDFGQRGMYTAAVMLWSFLSQVLRDGKEAACQAAVARVISYCQLNGLSAPTADTGDYCRARAKLPAAAIRELSCEVAAELETSAEPAWLWKGQYHAKLIDGFTFTMPDTRENQAEYPHPKSQQPGIGLPIARAVALISLATACVLNLKVGPSQGKETGESALLRAMLGTLDKGDIAVMDRYYCSFWLLALLQAQGTHVCARKHHLRQQSDFRRGRRLGYHDHLVTWTRPQRPQWMSEELYQQIPLQLTLRELRYTVTEKGRRTKNVEIITTLSDAEQYTTEDIAELYGFRWNCELDIRSLKSNLNLGHLRCKTPPMIERELWTTILGYNLIRATAAGAALLHGKQPRQISFTCTCQLVLASWMLLSCQRNPDVLEDFIPHVLERLASCEVANRPDRLEPRVLKRRRHGYKLMTKPRDVLKAELLKKCT